MNVPSTTFLAFAAAAALLFNLSRAIAWHRTVLLVANITFLASFAGSANELIPFMGFLLLGFVLIRLTAARAGAGVHVLAIVSVLACFFWLKRYSFVPAATFIPGPYVVVGLSYVFFRVLHLVIDARDADRDAHPGLVDYLNFTLNFTSIVSGPIQRFEEYRRDEREIALPLGPVDVGLAMERIVTGLFKILVMATLVDVVRSAMGYRLLGDAAFDDHFVAALTSIALYPVYLYFNFSGYTDLVIGTARFFRLRLPENFDRPFTAASFIDYWNRWHMSLSGWLRTYVYNPSLTAIMRRVRNPAVLPYAGIVALFVTFFLVGAWHGRTSKFMFFGLLNGGGVAVNQTYRIVMTKWLGRKAFTALANRPSYVFVGRGITFAWVAFTLLWFWSDWRELGQFVDVLGTTGIVALVVALPTLAAILLHALIAAESVALLPRIGNRPVVSSRYVRMAWLTAMLFFIAFVQGVTNAAAPAIVYKDF